MNKRIAETAKEIWNFVSESPAYERIYFISFDGKFYLKDKKLFKLEQKILCRPATDREDEELFKDLEKDTVKIVCYVGSKEITIHEPKGKSFK